MGKFRRRLLKVFFLFMSKTMLEVGWSFILWSMLYLEGWSSRSKLFYWCGLIKARLCRDITLDSLADVILLDIGTYQICIYMIIQVIAIFLQNIMFQLI